MKKKRFFSLLMAAVMLLSAVPVSSAAGYSAAKISGSYLGADPVACGVVNVELSNGQKPSTSKLLTKDGRVLKTFDSGYLAVIPCADGNFYYWFDSFDSDHLDEIGWGDASGKLHILEGMENTDYRNYVLGDNATLDFILLGEIHEAEEGEMWHRRVFLYDTCGNRVYDQPVEWVVDRGNRYLELYFEENESIFIDRVTWKTGEFMPGCYDGVGGLGVKMITTDVDPNSKIEKEYGVYNDKGELQFTLEAANWPNEFVWNDGLCPVYEYQSRYTYSYYGLIDEQGGEVLPREYAFIDAGTDGVYRAAKYSSSYSMTPQWGLMDGSGKVILDWQYAYITPFTNGIAAFRSTAYSGDQGGFIDMKGRVLRDDAHYVAGENPLGRWNVYIAEAEYGTTPDGDARLYLADSQGNRLSDYYRAMGPISEGLCVVYSLYESGSTYGHVAGVIDLTGRLVVPVTYKRPGSLVQGDEAYFSGGAVVLQNNSTGSIIKNPLMTEGVTAKKNAAKLLVDGQVVSVDAYNIGGSNYFKLRDVAALLTGSEKQFNVVYNSAKKCVELKRNTAYHPTASDLLTGGPETMNAKYAEPVIYADGGMVNVFDKYGRQLEGLMAYNIGGSNYFKLRDLGQFIDFAVGYSTAENCISIDTTKSYR